MSRLKEWAHRTKWIAGIVEAAKDRRRALAFDAHLEASVGAAVRWRHADDAVRVANDAIRELSAIAEPPPRKGSPSKVSIRAPLLAQLTQALQMNAFGTTELRAAERVASIDPAELAAFKLYLAVFWLSERERIDALRAFRADRIALHMTCLPRLDRAERSIASFALDTNALTHVRLVGSGSSNGVDVDAKLLRVATADSYECLPQKVFQGLALLALAIDPSCVLKLDDDHRLANADELTTLLDYAARAEDAVQLGEVNRTPSPSAHHRGWHFGKCARGELNERILEMPAPPQWAAGSSGYILNRGALWRVLWASLYYRQWLEEILYEDIALAEVATHTGIRIVQTPMHRAIGTVADY